jgi:hypothetical protein
MILKHTQQYSYVSQVKGYVMYKRSFYSNNLNENKGSGFILFHVKK